jgi:hypothetical protein
MSTEFHNAIAGALNTAAAVAGGSATYRRGEASVCFSAVCSPQEYEAADADGAVITYHCHDWLVIAAKLILGGLAVTPQAGDTITDAAGAVHEVMMVPNRNCYDSGFDDLHYRIHAKKVA